MHRKVMGHVNAPVPPPPQLRAGVPYVDDFGASNRIHERNVKQARARRRFAHAWNPNTQDKTARTV
jgi:hypothetical protein